MLSASTPSKKTPGKKMPYGREVTAIISLIHGLYPERQPRNLDLVVTAIYKLLERQSNDIALEHWYSQK